MKVCTYNQVYFSELQWYSSFVLLNLLVLFVSLVSIAYFYLVSVPFNLVYFLQ
jgi:hypothetical protein